MIQPAPMPEKLMGADPDLFIEYKLAKTEQGLSFFGKEALEEYKRCFRNPETDARHVRGLSRDLAASISRWTPRISRRGKKITCPSLILWGATGAVGRNQQAAAGEIWKDYATDIRGAKALPCGHYLSEEAPEETYAELRAFFKAQ